MSNKDYQQIREQLAAIEYERWSNPILRPYVELSPKEKESNLDQVDRYWPLIMEWHNKELVRELEELESLPNVRTENIHAKAIFKSAIRKRIDELKG